MVKEVDKMAAETSVLKSIRKAVGLDSEDSSFDEELLMHANTALFILNQNGVGGDVELFDETRTWDDFKATMNNVGSVHFMAIRSFVFIKVKMLFDPPPPSSAKYMAEAADEYLWRLREAYDVGLIGLIVEEDEL